MKVLLRILLLLALVVYLVFAVTRFNNPKDSKMCSQVNVCVEDSAKAVFITTTEIRNILGAAKVYPLGKKISEVDCYKMEKILSKNPFIKNALCYKTAGGQVVVKVEQRLPVMRVISDSGENYFIDSQGKQFTKSASGKVVSTTFLRLGSAPLGSDSKVLRPMRTACPVVSSLKRFISLGRCQSNCKFLPIALSSAIAAMIDIVLILFN